MAWLVSHIPQKIHFMLLSPMPILAWTVRRDSDEKRKQMSELRAAHPLGLPMVTALNQMPLDGSCRLIAGGNESFVRKSAVMDWSK
jgi:hypothetical protein